MVSWTLLILIMLTLGLAGLLPARAATPPVTVNYQGVLRDQNDKPLTGTYEVVFRFYDAATFGNFLMGDSHTTVAGGPVTASNGLFNVVLGTGTISGPFTSLDMVFQQYGSVWLEVQVGGETLAPRTQIQSAAYSLNSTNLAGHPSSYFLDTSSTAQEKDGRLAIVGNSQLDPALSIQQAPNSNAVALSIYGDSGALQADGGDLGWGGSFTGAGGIVAYNRNANSWAGNFQSGVLSGIPWGSTLPAGRFQENNGNTTVDLSTPPQITPNFGINETGGDFGGHFQTTKANSVGVYASGADKGFRGDGGNYGGYFQASNSGSYGLHADGVHTGVEASGQTRGAYFSDSAGDNATLAGGGMGISASSTGAIGSYFSNGSPFFSYTQIPYYDLGIYAYGANYGGQFNAFSTSNYAQLAYSTYKIRGTGTVSFVQNHPTDPSKVIVYVAPEGDEAAVYTRGSGKLANGEARVKLGETFALVTNPDIGLTATATPRGEPIPLAVSEVSPSEVVVRGPAGSSAEFDYMVWGLRIGFEEQSIVQPKKEESKIPSMHDHEKFFEDEPGLRDYTALARFKGVEKAVHGKKSVDLSRADKLRGAVGVSAYRDPKGLEHEPGRPAAVPEAQLPPAAGTGHGTAAAASPFPPARAGSEGSREIAAAAGVGNIAAGEPHATMGLDLFDAEGAIEAGDVVSLVPNVPGSVSRSAGPTDPLVIGCVQLVGADAATVPPAKGPSTSAVQVAVATSHVSLCRVDASNAAIAVGDRLMLSPAPGMAMKLDPGVAGATFVGRAIDPLPSGEGLIRVLLEGR
jgi:hypothetical protein